MSWMYEVPSATRRPVKGLVAPPPPSPPPPGGGDGSPPDAPQPTSTNTPSSSAANPRMFMFPPIASYGKAFKLTNRHEGELYPGTMWRQAFWCGAQLLRVRLRVLPDGGVSSRPGTITLNQDRKRSKLSARCSQETAK